MIFSKSNPLTLGFDLAGGFAAVWEKNVLVWENQKVGTVTGAREARRYGRRLLGKNQTFSGSG